MSNLSNNNGRYLSPEVWEQFTFDGKEHCWLNESGELMLKGSDHCPSRKLMDLTDENYQSVVLALTDKFKELEAKLHELQEEWEQAEDKLKMAGKVFRTKDYMDRAHALGNYLPFYESLKTKQDYIRQQFELNYAAKLQLVEQAEALKDSDDWKTATESFREIHEHWKQSAPVERHHNEELWERIDQARNHFFDRKRQHNEELEEEMMQNLDLKMELCDRAEELAKSEEWRKTSEVYKDLLEQWKQIGRVVSHEKNEELWQRFITARNTFFDRKRGHYEAIQQEQESNYTEKLALVERTESIAESTDWKETSQEMAKIMEQWKGIGRVPFEKSDDLWKRLQSARDKFFEAKRRNAEEFRVGLEDNYAQKLALLNRAEALMNTNTWRESTEELNELMTEWKKIGHSPREYGDEIWERFIKARKHFFNRKDADRERKKSHYKHQLESKLQQTKQFLARIQAELKDEEERLAEFKTALTQTNPTAGGK